MHGLIKKLSVFQQEEPDQPELELKREIEHRTLLLIKARWVIILMGMAYGIIALTLHFYAGSLDAIRPNILPVAIAFLMLIGYNTWYTYSYRWFTHLKMLNHAQIIFDIIFSVVFIHYTGGVRSWLWVIYPLLIIESAVSLNTKRDTWMIAILCTLTYGILFIFEEHRLLPVIGMPFVTNAIIFWVWVALVNLYFAFIGNYLIGVIKTNEENLKKEVVRDGLTGLYNHSYFFYRLTS